MDLQKIQPRSKQQKKIVHALLMLNIAMYKDNELFVDKDELITIDIEHLNKIFPIKRLLKMSN